MTSLNTSANVVLRGYDVVAYFDGAARPGDPALSAMYQDSRFYFATPENRDRFLASPDRYLPMYGGFCATAMSEGKVFDVDPTNFQVVDGQLYLFYNGVGGNTRPQWNAEAETRKRQADEVWNNQTYVAHA